MLKLLKNKLSLILSCLGISTTTATTGVFTALKIKAYGETREEAKKKIPFYPEHVKEKIEENIKKEAWDKFKNLVDSFDIKETDNKDLFKALEEKTKTLF